MLSALFKSVLSDISDRVWIGVKEVRFIRRCPLYEVSLLTYSSMFNDSWHDDGVGVLGFRDNIWIDFVQRLFSIYCRVTVETVTQDKYWQILVRSSEVEKVTDLSGLRWHSKRNVLRPVFVRFRFSSVPQTWFRKIDRNHICVTLRTRFYVSGSEEIISSTKAAGSEELRV